MVAFETGPGNMVVDALVSEHTEGRLKFDRAGRVVAKGKVDDALLAACCAIFVTAPSPRNPLAASNTVRTCARRARRCPT